MMLNRLILTFIIIVSLLGCADNKPTAIVVSIATDLQIPKELDQLTLVVEQQNKEQANLSYWLDPQKENHVDLPATITIVAGKALEEPISILVVGKLKSSDVVSRKAKLSFVKDKVLLLRMDLLQSCVNATNCENGQTCTENGCQSIQVDSTLLPEYDPSIGPIGLDAGTDLANDGSAFDSVTSETSPPDIGPKDIQLSDGVDSCISCDSTTKNDSAPPITWTTVTSGTWNNLNGIWGSASNNIWAVGIIGTILHYDGKVWSKLSALPTTFGLNAIWGISANNIWAVGTMGTILHYDGSLWNSVGPSTGATINLQSIWGSSINNIWAIGSQVYVVPCALHYDGNDWFEVSVPTQNKYGIWGNSANDIWAVGGSGNATGAILHYNGSVWSQHTNFLPLGGGAIRGIWGSAANNIWAVGDYGKIYHYDGLSWTIYPTTFVKTLYGVWGSAANDIWAVGASGTILYYDGTSWTNISSTATTSTLNAVWGSSANDVWAVGNGGVILHHQ